MFKFPSRKLTADCVRVDSCEKKTKCRNILAMTAVSENEFYRNFNVKFVTNRRIFSAKQLKGEL